jgi:hypothetical protein
VHRRIKAARAEVEAIASRQLLLSDVPPINNYVFWNLMTGGTSRAEAEHLMGGLRDLEGAQSSLTSATCFPFCLNRRNRAARAEAEHLVGGLREAIADRHFLGSEARRLQADLDAALLRRADKQATVL